jgi:hypothetical protein
MQENDGSVLFHGNVLGLLRFRKRSGSGNATGQKNTSEQESRDMFHRLAGTAGKSIGFLKKAIILNNHCIRNLMPKARKSLLKVLFEQIKNHAL